MKFAIPLADGKLTAHFGHCKMFAIVTVGTGTFASLDVEEIEPPPHEPGLLPEWLHAQGVTHVIAGGLGQKARTLMEDKGIHVSVGAPVATPETLVQDFLAGKLTTGTNLCDH